MLAKKGEGTFSEVLKAQCIKTSKYVAIKCMKSNFDSIEQVLHLPLSPYPPLCRCLINDEMLSTCSMLFHCGMIKFIQHRGAKPLNETIRCIEVLKTQEIERISMKQNEEEIPQFLESPKNTLYLVQVTSLREIQALQRLSPHPNVIKLLEVL